MPKSSSQTASRAPFRLLSGALCLIALASCGGGSSNNPPPPQPPDNTPPGSCSSSSLAKPRISNSTAEPARILVFSATADYRHDSISAGQNMLQSMASNNGWSIDLTENAADFHSANLQNYEVVVWLNTTGDVLNPTQQSAFEDYIENGGGYVGIHSAADTEYDWPWYGELVGAWFTSHPAIQTATLNVENRTHASSQHLSSSWQHRDEWYNFRSNPRADVNVVLSLDENSYDPNPDPMGDHPIAWYHRVGEGRAFYTGLGHTSAAYSDSDFVQHIEGALLWAGRMDKNVQQWSGSPPPNSDFSTTTVASNINEPMALEISAAGEIFIIGRRGEFYALENGNLIEKSVFQTNSTNEGGLIGFALAPDFASSRHIYFHYTSATSAEHIVSRITLNTDNSLDFSSELELLRYEVQLVCCHVAGDLAFDSEGNLYIAAGDNTDPFESDGYSPIDERAGRLIYDAQRTAANTNDLRGKILRIKPNADGSYEIPKGNLFEADSLHRAEIYSMGHRNPFRIYVDKTTDWLYWGDIGADAGGSNPTRGPGGTDEINRTASPGNFGWPYFTGSQAYHDYDFATLNSGAQFDPEAVVNLSPNNSGASELPNAISAWIDMSHRALMAGDVYHWNSAIDDEFKLPSYFHNRLLFWNFNNDYLYEVSTLEDQPSPRQWLNTSAINGMIDAEISTNNNRLYLLGYGGNCCSMPENAGMLVEVRYHGSGPPTPSDEITTFEVGDTVNLEIGGRIVHAQTNNTVTLVNIGASNNEIFELVDAADGAVALRSVTSGLYLTAGNRGVDTLSVDASSIGIEQQFEYEQYSDGSISLRAYVNCRYVVMTPDDQGLIASAEILDEEARFHFNFAQACNADSSYGLACRGESPAYLNLPATPASDFSNVPALLSQTGAFADVGTLTPNTHLIPYDLISPLWSDRADKQRWFAVPTGARITFSEEGGWSWPAGTVFIKHFALPTDENDGSQQRRLETRFIVVQESGVYGVTYKWRADNSDADLLTTAVNEDITIGSLEGDWTQTWTYPAPDDCLTCHNPEANHVLGPKTASLNKTWRYPSGTEDNQLRTLANLGLFSTVIDEDDIATFPAHAALDDESQSPEKRLRSYWDINCGNCHGPLGIAAYWDGRFSTPLAMQGIINGALSEQRDYFADYGLENPFVVDPSDINNSILYIRTSSTDPADRMPPLGRTLRHEQYLQLLESWINGLE